MGNANVKLIEDLYAAFGRDDVAAILAALDPHVDWASVGRSSDYPAFGPRKGIKAVEDFFRIVAENQVFAEFSPQTFHAADDKVFVLGHYALTMKRTGRKIASEWVHVFTIGGGKVVRWREHTDTAQFAEAWKS